MDYDGNEQRPLSGHQSISMAPAWSPPGDGLAYVSYFSGHPVDLLGGARDRRQAPDRRGRAAQLHAHVLARTDSGSRSRARSGATPRSSRSTVAAAQPVQLTKNARIDANPAWSPNGREIAFTSDRSGTPQIYVMDTDGGNLRRVSREGLSNDGAAWHPEGKIITYARRNEAGQRFDIAITSLETEETRLLTSEPGRTRRPRSRRTGSTSCSSRPGTGRARSGWSTSTAATCGG